MAQAPALDLTGLSVAVARYLEGSRNSPIS
jgi:hypothetical protein